mmetsp:Transcript_25020/g.49834  ORF Transcript_25020/g.49834 Transcript_25020/m.49834 type:complete len:257 (-) Transcript_25020:52-822(-)
MAYDDWSIVGFVGAMVIWLWFLFESARKVIVVYFPRSSFAATLSAPLLDKLGGGRSPSRQGAAPMVNEGDEDQRSADYSPESGVEPSLTQSGRVRQGTVTVHFRLFKAGSDTSWPLRQWMVIVQILIQGITAMTTRDEVGVIVGGNGWLSHGIKLFTWLLALIADKLRGNAIPQASLFLPISTSLLALSATYGLSWPPDPKSSTPVFALLDVVFMWSFFAVTLWSAVGCVHLSESGGMKVPESGARRSVGGRGSIV